MLEDGRSFFLALDLLLDSSSLELDELLLLELSLELSLELLLELSLELSSSDDESSEELDESELDESDVEADLLPVLLPRTGLVAELVAVPRFLILRSSSLVFSFLILIGKSFLRPEDEDL